jgi:hypothetical protein
MTCSISPGFSALVLLAASLATACSSGDETSTSTGGTIPPPVHAGPPAAGPAKAPDGTGSATFAVSRYFLGDTDLDGKPSTVNGWKKFGFDLDGKISTSASTDLCKPDRAMVSSVGRRDGTDGIDNAFGESILGVLRGLNANFADDTNKALAAGGSTLLFDLEKLGAGPDYNPLPGRFYVGTALGTTPLYDGSDAWPVRSDLLADPADITTTKVRFPDAYVVDGTWVGHADGDIPLALHGLPSSATPVHFVIHHAVVTLTLDASHDGVARGTLAGILSSDLLVVEANRLGREIDLTFCTDDYHASIDQIVRSAADILTDGTQDPARTCDGVSIGLGFEAKRVQLGAPTAPPATDFIAPDPCL